METLYYFIHIKTITTKSYPNIYRLEEILINDSITLNKTFIFASPRSAKIWTKRECFCIVGEDTPEYY